MTRVSRRAAFSATALGCILFAAACSSGKDANLKTPTAPRQVTAKPAGGSPGIGPVTVSNPRSTGGKGQPQQVVLSDRVLIIGGATVRAGATETSSLVSVDLTIQNRGPNAIANKPSFFEIMGAEGDIFAKQDGTSGAFYATVGPHTSRTGRIAFEIPRAATSSLRLMYRPGGAARTVIVALTTR